jgi:hypothetical protein
MPFHDDEEAELDHSEYPEPDAHENGFVDTKACPSCRAQIYEDTEWCPRCGHHLTRETDYAPRPLWFIIAALLCLGVALAWAIWG